jgi:hypothetical protein
MMRNKLVFLTGVGIGYVLGTRAGRQRYEQLVSAGRRLKENPTIQETAGILQAQAGELMSTAKGTVSDKLGHTTWGSKVTQYLHHDEPTTADAARAQAGTNGIPATTPRSDF